VTPESDVPSPIDRAFGAESRQQLLTEYFASAGSISAENAWTHVYRLLLWTDRTTGLAHCYESDKAQPGRPWYERSLAFHDWLSGSLNTAPHEVAGQIDWLFRRGTERLAGVIAKQSTARTTRAAEQRALYEGRGFPEPGDDPALESLIREALGEWLSNPPDDVLSQLTRKIQLHLALTRTRR